MNRRATIRLRIIASLVMLLLITATRLAATNLTGTFKHPDGSLVNGKLIFLLSQPARLSDNSAQIVPMVKIFSVTNGTLETGAFVYGNDVLVPAGTHYLVRLVDGSNNLLFEQKWYISGTTLDLGTLTPTTTGVVLPDPLLRNTGTTQTVQGPVNFSSPITAFTLTLNGNISPAAGDVFDLGNAGAPWRELFSLRWNNFIRPGNQTATVTDPASAPTVAVEATSGGSFDNSTRYFKIDLVNWNGATLASSAATLTPSTCGGGACTVRVQVAGTEWKTGAFAFRAYCSTDNVTFHRQSGFAGELDTTGALNDSHYVPGDIILTACTATGVSPPSTNTATIDADQVALNAACTRSANQCGGTLEYNANSNITGAGVYTPAQTGTTPLVVAVSGAKIRGHSGGITHDYTSAGSTRKCSFAHAKIGCVMVMEVSGGADIRGLSVESASNGFMLYKSRANGSATANNQITIGEAAVKTTGSLVVDGVKVDGNHYYLNFPELHISTQTSGVGCAAFSVNRAAGAHWLITGAGRWTVRDSCHVVRSDPGPTDPDRGVGFQGLPNSVSNFHIDDLETQMSANSGNKTPFLMTNIFFDFNHLSMSDWVPTAGVAAVIELGVTVDGAGACCGLVRMRNSLPASHANAATTFKVSGNSGSTINGVYIENSTTAGSGASAANAFDMNNVGINLTVIGDSTLSCDPNATSHKVANIPANATLVCFNSKVSGANDRMANLTIAGGTTIKNAGNHAAYFQCWWPTSNNYECYDGNGNTAANRISQFIQGSRAFTWFQSGGSTPLINYGSNNVGIGRSNSGVGATLAFPNNWSLTARNNANSADLGLIKLNTSDQAEIGDANTPARFPRTSGSAPMVVDSTTEVANLNAQQWHGKQAIDFSASLDFGSIAAQTCAELTITATGAVANNPVASAWPAALEAGLIGSMRISAADTATVRLCNVTSGAVDPANQTFAGRVIK